MTTRRVETWTSEDGFALHLVHTRPDAEPRAHVLVVHGFGEHGGRQQELVDALARGGLASVTVDLRGHGRSEGVRALVKDRDRLVADVTLLLEGMQARPAPVALHGHSFGGALAARVAQQRPDLLDALVLSAPYLVTGLAEPPWLLRVADAASYLLPTLRTKRIPPEVISSLPQEVQRYRADPLNDHGGTRLASARELHALGREVLDDAEDLVTPTLIVHGEADGLADPEGSRRLAAGAGGDDVTLRTYPGGFHELIHDAGADRVLTGIVEWLQDRLGLLDSPTVDGQSSR